MTEDQRKIALLFSASILAARKLNEFPEQYRGSAVYVVTIANAVLTAEDMLEEVERESALRASRKSPPK